MQADSRLWSIMKAVTWRLVATGTTFVLAYTVFQSTNCEGVLAKSSLVAGLELVIKLVLYYLHERAWLMASRRPAAARRREPAASLSSER